MNILAIQPSTWREPSQWIAESDNGSQGARRTQSKAGASPSTGIGASDPLTRERLAQLIEELELKLQDQREVA